jgi:hypothetical protein
VNAITEALAALRGLAVDQQVALLFLVLFGALALVTTVVFALTWSEEDASRERRRRLRHDLRALWLGSIVFWVAWISGPVGATLTFGAISFLALREFITLVQTRRGDHRGLIIAFFFALPLQYVLVGTRAFDLFTVFVPVYVFLPSRWTARWPAIPAMSNIARAETAASLSSGRHSVSASVTSPLATRHATTICSRSRIPVNLHQRV